MSETVSQIGRYKILGELGRGGFGRVYRAYDPSVGRQLAIKLLTGGGKEILARFRNEAKVAGNLRHENIVTVYEYGEHEGQPFLAMEYLEGEDLFHVLASRRRLTLLEKCEIMAQVAEGLACAHRAGVIHRDIKPANIMVLPDGRVKIMDFGIARITQNRDATRLTQEGWLIGTVLYMAPEQFSGGEVNSLSDIFAYGVVFYELLTGKHPFEATDSRRLMYNISFAEPPPIADSEPQCPDALERILRRLIAKDRDVRYQSLKDVVFDIDLLLTDLRKQRAEELVTQAQQQIDNKDIESAQSLISEALRLDGSHRLARSLHETLQRQLQHRALQPRVDAFMSAGEEHLAERRLAEAVQSFESALRLDSENINVQGRLAFARGLLDRSKAAASLVTEARGELDRLNLTLASRKLSDALRHDPENAAASELMSRIQREMDNRQREQRVEAALRRAEGLILLRSFGEAIELLEGLGEDAKSQKVESLLTWLRAEKQERERKEYLKAEMAAATELLRARRLDEAVRRLEALQQSYPEEQEVAHLLAYAHKEMVAEARARAVDEVGAKANALVAAENFAQAITLLENGLKQYPGEIQLIRLLGNAMAAKADSDRRRAIDAAVRDASKLREQRRYAEAIELVETTLRDYSSDPALLSLLEQLEQDWANKRRDDAIRKAVEQAENLLRRGEPFDAQQQLRQALVQYPDDARLTRLLQRADEQALALEKARAIEDITREVSVRSDAQDFTGALAAIDQGLRKWSGETALLTLRTQTVAAEAAWKRRNDIQAASQRAAGLSAAGKFAEALAAVADAARTYPGDPQLEQLEARIKLDWERHKWREAVRGVASEARLLLNRGRLDEAADLLKDALSRYSGEPELDALATQVRDAIQARERARAVEKLVRESKESVAAGRFDDARASLEAGLATFPREPALIEQLEAVKTAKKEWERQQAAERAIAEALRLAGEHKFEQALAALSRVGFSSPALVETRNRIERERSQYERRNAIEKSAADAAALIANGQPDEAIKLLNQLSSRYPDEPNWKPLMERAQAALAERKAAEERRNAIEKTVREVEKLTEQNRFDDAFARLRKALERYPGDDALLEFEDRLKHRHEQYRRTRAVEQAAAQAESLIAAGRFEEAVAALSQSCATFPAEAVLRTLLARAEKALESNREIERALAEGRQLIDAERFEDALQLLERTLAAQPGHAALTKMAAAAREKLELRRQEEAIAAIAEGARSVAQARDFDRALVMVDRGLEKWPRNERLLELQRSLRADREHWQRQQSRRQTIEDLQQLVRQQRYSEARKRAEQSLETYPKDPDLLRIIDECAMREILAQAAAAGAAGKPQEGLRILEQSAATYGNRPEWIELQNRLRGENAALERLAAIRKIAQQARDLAAANDFDAAFQLLTRSRGQYPKEAELEQARQAVADLKAAHDRKAAIEKRVAECARLAERGQFREAIDHARHALEEFPKEPALLDIRRRLEEQLKAHALREQRQQAVDRLRTLDETIARTAGSTSLAELRSEIDALVAQYQQDQEIRSLAAAPLEHLSAIEQAKTALLQRNFDRAMELCRQYLARFPEHATFSPLEKDAERGRRAASLDEIRRRIDAESDLATRAKLLEEALSRYPGEASLENELQFTRNKLGLIESIVAAARAHEAAGAWDQALEQWNKLATIYDKYPGLAAEIERARSAGEQANAAAITRWIAQIEPLVAGGDFDKARDLVTRALSELPTATALRELSRKIDELRDQQRRIRELQRALRGLREGSKWDQLEANAQESLQLSASHPKLRASVIEKLIEQVRAIADRDWRRAESLLAVIQSADAQFTVPEDLQRVIAKGKRQTAIEAAVQSAEQLRSKGSLREALAELERAISQFPDDSRLQSLRKTIDEQLRKQRAEITAELNQIRAASDRATTAAELDTLNSRASAVTARAQTDPELAALVRDTTNAITTRRRQLSRARISTILREKRTPILIGAAVAAIALGWFIFKPSGVSVTVDSNVAGASVSVAGQQCVTPQCSLSLKPGSYTLTASKKGFQTVTIPVTVANSAVKVPLSLQPVPEQLQVNTNLESGSVYIDGNLAGPLRNSQFSHSGIAPGAHDIRITGGDAEFDVQWRSAAGEQPQLIAPISARNVQAAVITSADGKGAIACNCDASKTLVDGAPADAAQPNGTTSLPQLAEGARQMSIDGRSMAVNVPSSPALNIFLTVDRNVGILVIHTGVDDAKVYVNNQLNPRHTEQGILRLPLPVGPYTVRVEKDNFRSPAPQTANLGKGEEKQLDFVLTPALVALEITGAQPHAQVRLDGRPVGETDAAGRFRGEVTPGAHSIELSKDGFAPARFEGQFNPGRGPVRPTPAQLAMAKAAAPQPPPSTPPAPDNKKTDTDAQEWAAVAGSNKVDDLQEYLGRHRGGPHARDAQALIDQLQKADAVRRDDADWNALDKNNRAALQDYLNRHSGGRHAQDAQTQIQALEKADADTAAAAAAAERKKSQDRVDQKKASDTQAIQAALSDFAAAYSKLDARAIAQVATPAISQTFNARYFGQFKSIVFQLTPSAAPVINGDSAIVVCNRNMVSAVAKSGDKIPGKADHVRVTLVHAAGRWMIQAIDQNTQ